MCLQKVYLVVASSKLYLLSIFYSLAFPLLVLFGFQVLMKQNAWEGVAHHHLVAHIYTTYNRLLYYMTLRLLRSRFSLVSWSCFEVYVLYRFSICGLCCACLDVHINK
jgi:hypothetical protein